MDTITIRTRTGDAVVEATRVGPLAIHQPHEMTSRHRWQVTHIASGCRIGLWFRASKGTARAYAEILADAGGALWHDERISDRFMPDELRARMQPILRDFTAIVDDIGVSATEEPKLAAAMVEALRLTLAGDFRPLTCPRTTAYCAAQRLGV